MSRKCHAAGASAAAVCRLQGQRLAVCRCRGGADPGLREGQDARARVYAVGFKHKRREDLTLGGGLTFIAARAADFIQRQHKAGRPFFAWVNFTHMHFRTHTKPESLGQSGIGQSPYHDTMIDHDKNVGSLLDLVDELGIADNTIVFYSTDNGPHKNSWPDAGSSPFRNEKNTDWEGGYRVPAMVRWPGKVKAGTVSNEIISHLDWMPTFLALPQRVRRM